MKVAIVCGAPSSELLAPFDDASYEIWVLGNRYHKYRERGLRVSRIFEIHDNLSEHGNEDVYRDYLVGAEKPLIVGEVFKAKYKDAPHVDVFPYNDVEKHFKELYLTSSPAYMIAYAILSGVEEIAIYGVDLSISDHEYFWQRPCVEYWIGYARGIGIKVTIPAVSHICKSKYIEGRHWNNESDLGVFSEESLIAMAGQHKAKMAELQKSRQELALKAAAHDGAAQAYESMANIARAVEAKIDVKTITEATLVR